VRHRLRLPVLVLVGVGLLLLVVGAVGVFAGLALADRIYALLPSIITADADAIGGAAMALGIAAFLVGGLHLGMAVALARTAGAPREPILVTGIALCAVMAVMALGWSVAALVSAASGSAPADAMLPAGFGLLALAVAYGLAAVTIMRVRRTVRGRI
jgi:hypothetical protein